MDVEPCEFDELIDWMPAMVENSRSSGVATDDAIVSGLAPGRTALHLDRRIVDARQRRDRQRAKPDDAEQQDRERDERRHDRTLDEDA